MGNLCEIRIVSYRKPLWLKDCLDSIIKQTHINWKAIILDDSPDDSCEKVVDGFADERFVYKKNQPRAGCSGNINKAFSPNRFFESEYACVVEDDSWFYPDYLNKNIESLSNSGVSVMLRNAAIWDRHFDPPSRIDQDTLEDLVQGVMAPHELHSYLFFAGCFNPSWFWKTNCGVNFTVNSESNDACEHEFLRVAQVNVPILFESEPLVAWGYAPSIQLVNGFEDKKESRRIYLRRQAKLRNLSRMDGPDFLRSSARIAERLGKIKRHSLDCSDALIINRHAINTTNLLPTIAQFVKALIKRAGRYGL